MKTSNHKKGLWAEYLCAVYLFLCGYRILEHRYKTPYGEIDLVATKTKQLVFIEVKARSSAEKGGLAVSQKSMLRIENTAKLWLSQNTSKKFIQMRFDVMVVTSFYKKPKWYKNAWQSRGFSGRM